jgi:hypothetical protein
LDFWRVGKPQDPQPLGMTPVRQESPSAWIVACGCVLVVLAAVGFLNRNRVRVPTKEQIGTVATPIEELVVG